jgi:hypothetical protein
MAHTLTCDCGEILTGQDDADLFRLARDHIRTQHPDRVVSDGQLRGLIESGAEETDASQDL